VLIRLSPTRLIYLDKIQERKPHFRKTAQWYVSFHSPIRVLLGLSPLHHPEIIEIDRLVIILEQERKKRVAASSPNLKNSCITVVHAMLYCTSVYAVP
jgi:hypothetical protein